MKALFTTTPGLALLNTGCDSNTSVAAGTELASTAPSTSDRY